jgi:hypothetical protein
MATIDESSRVSYGLGHADDELERLELQSRLIAPITRRRFYISRPKHAEEQRGLVIGDVLGAAKDTLASFSKLRASTAALVIGAALAASAIPLARKTVDARFPAPTTTTTTTTTTTP